MAYVYMCRLVLFLSCLALATPSFLDDLEKPDVREIRTRLEEEKAKRLLLQNDVEVLMLKFEQLERECKSATSAVSATNAKQAIAFTARLTASTDIAVNEVIKFDQVTHNQGNGYSPNTGVFRAPQPGTYVFSLTLLYGGNDYVHASIVKNAVEIGRVIAGGQSTWEGVGSQTVVAALAQNDAVFVKEFFRGTTLQKDHWCSFTGVMI